MELSHRTLGLVLASSLLPIVSGCSTPTRPAGRPDVVLIMVDTLRADHLGSYGYSRPTSPAIDRFAGTGLLFENCVSHAPETRLAVASMLSGFLPHETGIPEMRVLPAEVPTLPETLATHGYRTAAVIGNYVLRRGQGFEQGFAVYDDRMDDREAVRRWPERIAASTTDRSIELIEQEREEPLFLWIVYQDPHGPYTPPAPMAGMFVNPDAPVRDVPLNSSLSGRGGVPSYQQVAPGRTYEDYVARYDGEIRYLDGELQRLFDAMDRSGMLDEALIVFTSDHGEGMGEHDYYFAHGEYLYRDQTHVPLILRWGDRWRGREGRYVQHVDLVPTILRAAGIEPDPRLRGRDLAGEAVGEVEIFSQMTSPLVRDRYQYSLIRGGLKLIHTPLYRRFEMFDLRNDPAEERDLSRDPAHRESLVALTVGLERIRSEDRLRIGSSGPARQLTEEELRRLRSLGYVD